MSNLTELKNQLKNLKKGLLDKKTSLNNLKKNNPSNKTEIEKLQTQIKEYPNIIKAKEAAIQKLKNAGNTSNNPVPTQGAKTTARKNNRVPPKVEFIGEGKICITIDHLGTSPKGFTTENIVRQLLGLEPVKTIDMKKTYRITKPIPVTVFVQARGNFVEDTSLPKVTGKVPRQKVHHLLNTQEEMLTRLKTLAANPKYKLKFGVHLLGVNDLMWKKPPVNKPVKINDLKTEVQMQLDNITYLKSILNEPRIASYHGANAASVRSANHSLVQKQFDRIRDTKSASPELGRLKLINPGTTTQFFFHAAELKRDPDKYKLYRILLEGIQSGKYNAVAY